MNIKLNKNAELFKILDSIIDIIINEKTVSSDLVEFIKLFSLDIDDIKYMLEDVQDVFTNQNAEIIEGIYSNIRTLKMKKKYSFFLKDYSNIKLTESLNKIISITYIYQRFYKKIDSLEFLISIRYLSYDYGSFLYDIDGEKEYLLINLAEHIDNNKNDSSIINYEALFNMYVPNIFYEENDRLKKVTNYKQLKNCEYYFINNENRILSKRSDKSTKIIDYDISLEYVEFLNVSDLKEASFEQVSNTLLISLNKKSKINRNSKSNKKYENLNEQNFKNIYSYFSYLFSLTEKEYRNYIVRLINKIINRFYTNTTSLYSKLIVTGYICSKLDIGIKEKELDSITQYHSYLKNTIKNIIKKDIIE